VLVIVVVAAVTVVVVNIVITDAVGVFTFAAWCCGYCLISEF
jgi:hypothetical protein